MKYPKGFIIKKVSASGHIHHNKDRIYIGDVFGGCRIALNENTEGRTELHYANINKSVTHVLV